MSANDHAEALDFLGSLGRSAKERKGLFLAFVLGGLSAGALALLETSTGFFGTPLAPQTIHIAEAVVTRADLGSIVGDSARLARLTEAFLQDRGCRTLFIPEARRGGSGDAERSLSIDCVRQVELRFRMQGSMEGGDALIREVVKAIGAESGIALAFRQAPTETRKAEYARTPLATLFVFPAVIAAFGALASLPGSRGARIKGRGAKPDSADEDRA